MSLCPWQILVVVVFVGPCPVCFLLCFSAGWRSAYLAGGSAFRLLWFVFVVFCAVDLPSYMTTGVNVDVILNCFFSCKDRASERDRPYQRKKKGQKGRRGNITSFGAMCYFGKFCHLVLCYSQEQTTQEFIVLVLQRFAAVQLFCW